MSVWLPLETGPLTYQWYSVVGSTEAVINGATAPILSVSPEITTTYRVRVTNECGSDESQADVTVVDTPTVPTGVIATFDPALPVLSNVITWNASASDAGIDSYLLNRQPGNFNKSIAATQTSYVDNTGLVSGTTYVYTLRSRDDNGAYSMASSPEIALIKAFADDPILLPSGGGGTEIGGEHIAELRQAIDSVRAAAGLVPAWTSYTPPAGELVKAADFNELRNRLNEARELFFLPYVSFVPAVAQGDDVFGSVVTALRGGVK